MLSYIDSEKKNEEYIIKIPYKSCWFVFLFLFLFFGAIALYIVAFLYDNYLCFFIAIIIDIYITVYIRCFRSKLPMYIFLEYIYLKKSLDNTLQIRKGSNIYLYPIENIKQFSYLSEHGTLQLSPVNISSLHTSI